MTKPVDAIKAVIDESLAPRLDQHSTVLAAGRPDPLPVVRSDLHYVWDDYGNQYLDFASGMHPVGHRNPIVSGALAEHLRHYHFTAPLGHHLARWPVQYSVDLAKALEGPTEADTRVLFCEGEREAVQMSINLASAGKTTAVLNTGWHDWLMSCDTRAVDAEDWADIPWAEYGALLMSSVDVAAQPVLGAREMILCARTAGVPVIIDESVTGFGRTGPMWAQQSLGTADLTVLGGPVGGSLPLGAVVGAGKFFDSDRCDVSPQAGNPLACAAGSATLIALGLGVLDHTAETAPVLSFALTELASQFPEHVVGYHGNGHLRGLVLRRPDPGFHLRARTAGLLVAPAVNDTVVVLSPPLIASHLELKRGVDMLADALMSWDDEA